MTSFQGGDCVMLVLTRRIGEELIIADNIRVQVLGIKGKVVRLGFMAPSSIRVLRMELLTEDSADADATAMDDPALPSSVKQKSQLR
jgi:carbon storage regulator